jgi:Protein kinase domain/LIM domain
VCGNCKVNPSYFTCHKCKKQITSGNVITWENRYYHVGHFGCSRCNRSLEDQPVLMIDGDPCCESCDNTSAITCSQCMKPICDEDPVTVGENVIMHLSCIRCHCCNRQLTSSDKVYFQDGKLTCEKDFLEQCERCAGCGTHIIDEKIRLGGHKHPSLAGVDHELKQQTDAAYHLNCLRCCVCLTELYQASVYLAGPFLLCEKHQDQHPVVTCEACDSTLDKEFPVVVYGHRYHDVCTRCSFCDMLLVSPDGYPRLPELKFLDNHLCCNTCAELEPSELTLSSMYGHWHEQKSNSGLTAANLATHALEHADSTADSVIPMQDTYPTEDTGLGLGENNPLIALLRASGSRDQNTVQHKVETQLESSQPIDLSALISIPSAFVPDAEDDGDIADLEDGDDTEAERPSSSSDVPQNLRRVRGNAPPLTPSRSHNSIANSETSAISSKSRHSGRRRAVRARAGSAFDFGLVGSAAHSRSSSTDASTVAKGASLNTAFNEAGDPTAEDLDSVQRLEQQLAREEFDGASMPPPPAPSRRNGTANPSTRPRIKVPHFDPAIGDNGFEHAPPVPHTPTKKLLARSQSRVSLLPEDSARLRDCIDQATECSASKQQSELPQPMDTNTDTFPNDPDSNSSLDDCKSTRVDYEMRQNGTEPKIDWVRGDLIGKGSFGKVFCGMNTANGELIAVKQVKLSTSQDQEHAKAIESEVRLMRGLNHPNIVRFLGTQRVGDKLNILMEYVPSNSLESLLHRFGTFPEKVICNYTFQLLLALEYCHEARVVHRDIKGKNILVDAQGHLKLCDFGSAKEFANALSKDAPSVSFNYTPLWTAPEVLVGVYNSKVDVWSLGCVIVEMATGKPPWAEQNFENPFRALYHIGNTDSTPAIPEKLSPVAQSFLRACFVRDPDHRPSAKELLCHEWIKPLTS